MNQEKIDIKKMETKLKFMRGKIHMHKIRNKRKEDRNRTHTKKQICKREGKDIFEMIENKLKSVFLLLIYLRFSKISPKQGKERGKRREQ